MKMENEEGMEKPMTNVLVTGGTGHLGRQVVTKLVQMGYTARIMSRQQPPLQLSPSTQWVQANVTTGQGLIEAMSGIDVLIHAMTDPAHAKQIDVDGTRRILEKAHDAGVAHIIYISIVGIDRIPFPYYQQKHIAEEIIQQSGIPWSVLRATQFHSFVDLLLQAVTKIPLIAVVPTDFKAQTIDESEVAKRLCELVEIGPSGRVSDLGGPQVLTLGEMAKEWLKQRTMSRAILPLWLPGKVARGFRAGYNTCPEELVHGNITWSEWLQRQYHGEKERREMSPANEGEDHVPTI